MVFRFARHTHQLQSLKIFYTQILGMEILGSFENHQDYNGIFLGYKNYDWHLEFTQNKNKATHTFDEDDLLVLYPKEKEKWEAILENISLHKIPLITPKNPYWNENGKMFMDPDGYRIIISDLKIK